MMRRMRIATWNVNSIKARLPRVVEWLAEAGPDVVLLQELKVVDEAFPAMLKETGVPAMMFGHGDQQALAETLAGSTAPAGLPIE